MGMTSELLKQRKLERKAKNKYISKKTESAILIELKETLEEYLLDHTSIMLEVEPRYVGEFMNTLGDVVLAIYDYEQVDNNKFVFRNRELVF